MWKLHGPKQWSKIKSLESPEACRMWLVEEMLDILNVVVIEINAFAVHMLPQKNAGLHLQKKNISVLIMISYHRCCSAS